MKPRLDGAVRGNLGSKPGAHVFGIRYHADAPQIKPVRIPARPDRRILVVLAVRVPKAGIMEELEEIVRQLEPSAANFGGELSPAPAVIRIISVVLAAAVVEEGEKPDNGDNRSGTGRQNAGVALDPSPVIGAVNRVLVAMIRLSDHRSPQGIVINLLHGA